MAQHKQSLEKVIQTSMRHKRAGTEVSTAILAIEAMVLTSISQNEIVENSDKKALGRCRAALKHKSYGKRLADAISTLDAIIEADGLSITAEDKSLRAQHKQGLRKVCQSCLASKSLGTTISDMVDKAEKAIVELIAMYPADADLIAIKQILES
jgi:hypothetical protein